VFPFFSTRLSKCSKKLTAFRYRVVLLNYREDGTTPYVIVWKHGLEEMKV
jgi:hypothetical protein